MKKEILRQFDINQEVLYAELDFRLIADISKSRSILYQEIPKFPLVRRDFALEVEVLMVVILVVEVVVMDLVVEH